MSVEDDIARIAALRGMDASAVREMLGRQSARDEAAAAQAEKHRTLSRNVALDNLFQPMSGTVKQQMAAFDALPKRSREFLQSRADDISARRWVLALEAFDWNEAALIEAVLAR